MKETEITIRVYNQDRHAEEERTVTAYADDRFPGLAIHGPWELGSDDWRITHVPSGLIYRHLAHAGRRYGRPGDHRPSYRIGTGRKRKWPAMGKRERPAGCEPALPPPWSGSTATGPPP